MTLSDYRRAVDQGQSVAYFSQVASASEYYPFGMLLTKGNYSSGSYRFGFQGQEMDDELKGTGNSYDFGARIYDSRVGRWMSCDPLAAKYPDLAPFIFVANNPLLFIDPNGKEIWIYPNPENKGDPVLYEIGMEIPNGYENTFVGETIETLNYMHSKDYGNSADYISYLSCEGDIYETIAPAIDGSDDLISWNSVRGIVTNGSNPTTGSNRMPPASGLMHEILHQYLAYKGDEIDQKIIKGLESGDLKEGSEKHKEMVDLRDMYWRASKDEEILIKNYETPINLEAGWGIRKPGKEEGAHSAGSVNYYKAESPTSTDGEISTRKGTRMNLKDKDETD